MILKSDRFIQIEDIFYFLTLENSELVIIKDIPGYGDFYSPFNKVDFSEFPDSLRVKMEQCSKIIVPHIPISKEDAHINNKQFLKYLRM